MSQRSESFDSPYQFQFSSCKKPPFSTFSLVIPSSFMIVTVKVPTFDLPRLVLSLSLRRGIALFIHVVSTTRGRGTEGPCFCSPSLIIFGVDYHIGMDLFNSKKKVFIPWYMSTPHHISHAPIPRMDLEIRFKNQIESIANLKNLQEIPPLSVSCDLASMNPNDRQ